MSHKTHKTGASLLEALTAAIGDLAGCDAEKVTLTIDAPGFDAAADLAFRVKLEAMPAKTVVADDDDDDDDDRDEVETAAEPVVAAPKARSGRNSRDDDRYDEDDDRDGRRNRPEREVTPITAEELEEEADAAADFLEGLLDVLELPGDLQIRTQDERAEVEVINVGGGVLIGRRGQTLEAIQELARSVLQRKFERRSRVQIDVEGYRARRLEKLIEKAQEAIDEVLDSGEPYRLEPMDVFERKEVHQLVTATDGVTSRSQGREPGRRVVIELED